MTFTIPGLLHHKKSQKSGTKLNAVCKKINTYVVSIRLYFRQLFSSFSKCLMITLLWKSSCLPMSEVYDDLLQKLFALCIGRNLLCAGRTKKRSEKRGAISPLIYSRIITAWTLSPRNTETIVGGGVRVPNGL